MSTLNTATPVRLKELKPLLQKDAMEGDDSLSKLIYKIAKKYLIEKYGIEKVIILTKKK